MTPEDEKREQELRAWAHTLHTTDVAWLLSVLDAERDAHRLVSIALRSMGERAIAAEKALDEERKAREAAEKELAEEREAHRIGIQNCNEQVARAEAAESALAELTEAAEITKQTAEDVAKLHHGKEVALRVKLAAAEARCAELQALVDAAWGFRFGEYQVELSAGKWRVIDWRGSFRQEEPSKDYAIALAKKLAAEDEKR